MVINGAKDNTIDGTVMYTAPKMIDDERWVTRAPALCLCLCTYVFPRPEKMTVDCTITRTIDIMFLCPGLKEM